MILQSYQSRDARLSLICYSVRGTDAVADGDIVLVRRASAFLARFDQKRERDDEEERMHRICSLDSFLRWK